MGIFDKVKSLLKSKDVKNRKNLIDSEQLKQDENIESSSQSTTDQDLVKEHESAIDDLDLDSEPKLDLDSDVVQQHDPSTDESVLDLNLDSDQMPVQNSSSKKEKLNAGLKKTKDSFFGRLARTVAGKSTIDELDLDAIEEVLITSDIGVETTLKIIERLEERVAKDKYINTSELNVFLKEEISSLMQDTYHQLPNIDGPYVIMVVGVNGVGKTTTIGKMAYQFREQGKKVLLGAADTFRAAAVDQLVIWADRVGVDIVKQDMGSDPASVAFDTIQSAKANEVDVVIIDTAGRLHNNVNLMRELGKIRSVMGKVVSDSPHDVMLVLDASTGQNAIEQAKQFTSATEVNSIALTKLDGTAKGGVVIGISDQFKIPVRYIGIGEGMSDLQRFNKKEFVDSLFK